MVEFLLLFWLLSAVVIGLFNIQNGIIILLTHRMLVPFSTFKFLGISLEFNYVSILVLFIGIMNILNKKLEVNYLFLKPLIYFTLFFAFSILFTDSLDRTSQVQILRNFVLTNFILPILVWLFFDTKESLYKVSKVIIICLVIMMLYGVYCFVTQSNPYVSLLSVVLNQLDLNLVFAGKERGGLVGRIQSTMFHPFLWSVFLNLSLFLLMIFREKKITYTTTLFICISLLNLLICGTRSGIVSFLVGFVFFLLVSNPKTRLSLLFGLLVIPLIGIDTSVFGKYQSMVDSIIFFYDVNKGDIGGSSLVLRLQQLEGAIELWLNGGVLFGNGFGWCANYYLIKGDHPILLGFESIIYVALIDNGLLGLFVWGVFFIYLFKINRETSNKSNIQNRNTYLLVVSYILSYVFFILITGIFGLNFFLIFIALMFRINSLKYNTQTL